jgi:hypothetical protein
MMEIFGAGVGFVGSIVPTIFKHFQDKSDKKHELEIMKLQMKVQEKYGTQRLAEINADADIKESYGLYKTFYSGIKWVDAFNGSVRPVLAYAFFGLYGWTKIAYFIKSGDAFLLAEMWTSVDSTIFLTIIAYFYGQRAMQKIMK